MKILLIVTFVAALNVLVSFGQTKAPQSNYKLSRLGVIGNTVFIVKQVAPFAEGSGVKVGDVITHVETSPTRPSDSKSCVELTNIEMLDAILKGSPVGTAAEIELLRFDSALKKFDSHAVSVETLAHPASASRSTLGLVLELGFLVKEIDSATEQPELTVNDIITDALTLGDVTDTSTFIDGIRKSKVNSTFRVEVTRFNLMLEKFVTVNVSLKTYPYPTAPKSDSMAMVNGKANAFALMLTGQQDPCRNNPCVWCCADCRPYLHYGNCATSRCETDRSNCREAPGGIGQCRFYRCA